MLPQSEKWISSWQRGAFEQGREQATARNVLEFLDARGLTITDAHRERILGCADLETLTKWVSAGQQPLRP